MLAYCRLRHGYVGRKVQQDCIEDSSERVVSDEGVLVVVTGVEDRILEPRGAGGGRLVGQKSG